MSEWIEWLGLVLVGVFLIAPYLGGWVRPPGDDDF